MEGVSPMKTYPINEARAHLSELVERALAGEPQRVTRYRKEAVVIEIGVCPTPVFPRFPALQPADRLRAGAGDRISLTISGSNSSGSNSPPIHSTISSCSGCAGSPI